LTARKAFLLRLDPRLYQALERWAAELDRIVTGGEAKVVALRRA
jgi:hypothetical protein